MIQWALISVQYFFFHFILFTRFYAFVSGAGKCGIAVIRVSGEKTKHALKSLTGFDSFKPRFATLKQIRDPCTQTVIDNGLVLFFQAPKSFTGEDSAEFQVHGGSAVVAALLSALSKVEGLRPAEPGEFTKRAFFNGKLDLTEVEGLADLIHAETENQRRQALIHADGHLSKLYMKWRTQLLRNIAHTEAYIDFSEDENIEDGVLDVTLKSLSELKLEMQRHLADGRKGERLREGVKMVILGDTNVGKSSLMNLLVQRDISIVTEIEGTTRDVVESHFDINGFPVVISDTAGLRKSNDIVESEGIARAKKCATTADLVILVIDGEKMTQNFDGDFEKFRKKYLTSLGLNLKTLEGREILTVVNKIDLVTPKHQKLLNDADVISISCTKSINIEVILAKITENLVKLCGDPQSESPLLSHARHRYYLEECLQNIENFLQSFDASEEQDFAVLAQNLRNAVRSIGKITGEVRIDDLLDVIFRDFCIGK